MTDIAVEARGLGKRYALGARQERHDTLRDLIAAGTRSLLRRDTESNASPPFWALQDATFDIRRGENVGLIGLNGAGKSTLLKVLSRIVEPTHGSARIHGRLGALLEVGTGFHWELTGRENVYLYGSILGMRKQDIADKFDAIVEFAEIEKFIDTPVKRYSSGMYVRLAFSVAAQLAPDILLLDEVLAVGDVAFQRKCMQYAKSLQRSEATILFVSHNMFSIKTMCSRVIYLKRGRVEFDGSVDSGIGRYETDARLSALSWTETKPEEWPLVLTGCDLLNQEGQQRTVFDFDERLTIRLHFDIREPVDNVSFIVAFIRSDGVAACNYSSETDRVSFGRLEGSGVVEVLTPPLKLVADKYSLSIIVRDRSSQRILCGQMGTSFHVRHDLFDTHYGVFHESATWHVGS